MFGQAGLGSITGTVVDPSGAVVPSASVRLTDIATKGVRAISTNDSGLFTLPSNIRVNGFQQISLGQLVLEIGQGAASAVTVTAEQQLISDTLLRNFAPYRSGTSLDRDMNHTYD